MKKSFISKNPEETKKIAKKMLLSGEQIFLLLGSLGSGKTTFVKGLAEGLGIKKTVTSPTYTYRNSYALPTSKFPLQTLYHFDLYRLPEVSKNPETVKAQIGLDEALNDQNAIIAIEWPERLALGKKTGVLITFKRKKMHHTINIH